MLTRYRFVPVMIVAIVGAVSVTLGQSPGIVGRWLLRSPQMEVTFEARADGSYARAIATAAGKEESAGAYKLADGVLELKDRATGEVTRLHCKLAGDQLEVTDDAGNGLRLVRDNTVAQPAAQQPAQPPAGTATPGFKPRLPLPQAPGGHIVYTRVVMVPAVGGGISAMLPIPKLFVMNGDGTGNAPFLAPADYTSVKEARWSPNYDRLAFTSDWMTQVSACMQDIFVVWADGTGLRRVTGNELRGPAPQGYGAVTGLIRDNTKSRNTDNFELGQTRLTINIAGQGGEGLVHHPGEETKNVDIVNQQKEKLREEEMSRFFLPKVAAGHVWVKVWSSRHIGNVAFVDVKPNTVTNIGDIQLNQATFHATRPSLNLDGRLCVGIGSLAGLEQGVPSPALQGAETGDAGRYSQIGGVDSMCVYDMRNGAVLASIDPLKLQGCNAKDPAVSPDGKLIACGFGPPVLEGLGLIGVEDMAAGRPSPRVLVPMQRILPSEATAFIGGTVSCGNPCWSPDGRTIAFTRGFMGTTVVAGDLWVIGADGGGLRQLTKVGSTKLCVQPCFSPDGSQVAFAVLTGKAGAIKPEDLIAYNFTCDLYRIGADGQNLQRLTNDGVSAEPAWGR